MKKPAVLRNDSPHKVQLTEGQRDAQSKTVSRNKEPETPPEMVPGFLLAKPGAAAPRARAAVTKKRATSKTAARPTAGPAPLATPQEPAVRAEPVWEAQSPILKRLDALRARNQALQEQLRRLQALPKGNRP